MNSERVYSAQEIAARIARELPRWRHEGGCLEREYRTAGWKGTLMVANAIGHLAEVAWHHPDLALSWDRVVVKLSTHSARGITDKDFALARRIEDLVTWRPGTEGGPLEGTPADDPRFAYIRYD